MRKFRLLPVLIAVLCLLGGAQFFARAEGQILNVAVAAHPDALVEPGSVTLSFTIENPSKFDAENICLSSGDGLDSEPIGRVAAGETESFTRTHNVTQAELDAGDIAFILSHDDPADPERKVNYGIHAALRRSDTQISAVLIRRLSTDCPAPGGTVTITYRVRNTGNVPLELLRVEDSLGDFSERIDRLDPGESELRVSRVTINEPSISHATLFYCAEPTGDEVYAQALEDAPIALSEPKLEMNLRADYSAFSNDTADAVLSLRNVGNADYENVSVVDDVVGGVIASGLRLPAGGEPVEIAHSVSVRGEGGFRWRVRGRCIDGTALDQASETVFLAPRSAETGGMLRLNAEVNTPRIRRAGDVRLHVTLENTGGTDLTDVTLSDDALGEMRTFAILPAESVIERDFVLRVEENTTFALTAACKDAASASAEPVEVIVASDGVLPEGERERFIEFTGHSVKIGGSTLFAVLLIAGCAVLLALIIMLVIASRRARFEKQVRIAAERRRRHRNASGHKNGKGRGN